MPQNPVLLPKSLLFSAPVIQSPVPRPQFRQFAVQPSLYDIAVFGFVITLNKHVTLGFGFDDFSHDVSNLLKCFWAPLYLHRR